MTGRKTISMVLDGQEMKMKFTLLSLARLEKEGVKLTELGKDMSLEQIMKVVWAGLSTFQPQLSVEEVGAMIDVVDLPMITEKMTEAFEGLNQKK